MICALFNAYLIAGQALIAIKLDGIGGQRLGNSRANGGHIGAFVQARIAVLSPLGIGAAVFVNVRSSHGSKAMVLELGCVDAACVFERFIQLCESDQFFVHGAC